MKKKKQVLKVLLLVGIFFLLFVFVYMSSVVLNNVFLIEKYNKEIKFFEFISGKFLGLLLQKV